MDKNFLHHYNLELQHLREMGEEFARENPKIAGRLGLSQFGCTDPYIERLMEGFAYLTARVHHKLDQEFPRFTRSILDTVYPQYQMPTPAMGMVRFEPDFAETDLAEGFTIPRHTVLRSIIGKGDRTSCQFSIAHETVLWPLSITAAEYEIGYRGTMDFPLSTNPRASLRLRLTAPGNLLISDLTVERLPVYLRDTNDDVPMRLYEQIFSSCTAVSIQSADKGKRFRHLYEDVGERVRQWGFLREQSLFPYDPRTFEGYRLVREYFAFPQRFMFFELALLSEAFRQCHERQIDIVLVFDKWDNGLEKKVTESNFALFATPVINLFTRRTDRVHLSKNVSEFHVVADRTRMLDYEIMQIMEVRGYGIGRSSGEPFLPFYSASEFDDTKEDRQAYYMSHRIPRHLTEKEMRVGGRSTYRGSEVYLSLVDAMDAPYSSDLRELGVTALCSNRDLPIQMPVGRGMSDFTLDINVPIKSVRCIEGPTEPRNSFSSLTSDWHAINHLSLNFLTLLGESNGKNTGVLQDILRLYCDPGSFYYLKQIDGITGITAAPVTRRARAGGPAAFVRGLAVTVLFNEDCFRGSGIFLLGSVLERFIGAYVQVNSFTETTIGALTRGEIKRWPMRSGIREQI